MCHQCGGQQQNKALEPHEEELDSEVGDAHCPQDLPEAQEFNSRAEEDEAEEEEERERGVGWWLDVLLSLLAAQRSKRGTARSVSSSPIVKCLSEEGVVEQERGGGQEEEEPRALPLGTAVLGRNDPEGKAR